MATSHGPGTPAKPVSLADQQGAASPRVGWLFAGLFLLYMFDYIDREVVSALVPYMKADLGLSDTVVSSLNAVLYGAITVLVFPASILIDRWSRKRLVGILVVIWSIATAAGAFVKSFAHLRLTRLAVGAGESGYSPAGTAMISAMYPVEKRSRMMGFWNASIPLGSAIGVVLGGVIAKNWGWKSAFGLVAVPGFIIGVLFFFLAKDYRTVKLEHAPTATVAARQMRFGDVAMEFLRKPSLLLTYFAFAGNTFLMSAILFWLPSYFIRTQGVPAEGASLRASLVMLMAIVGAPLGGLLVDRWRKRNISARPVFAGLGSLLSAVIWFIAFRFCAGATQYVVMFAAAIATSLYISAAAAVTQDVMHPGLWAISYSLCIVVQNGLGSTWGPTVVGSMSDLWGLGTAMTIAPAASVLAGLLFLLAGLFYKRDLAKTDNIKVEMEA
jgi:MFS family permease